MIPDGSVFLLTLRKIMNFMNWKNRHTPLLLLLITLVATALTGCSTSKFVPEDRYLLDAVQVRTDSKELDAAQFGQYVRQKGNSHWFSLFKIPLGTYSLAGRDSTKWLNRTLRHIGEKPVVYDSLEAARSCADLRLAMQNMGYMNSYVDFETQVRGRKLKAVYTLHPGDPYRISSFRYDIPDSAVAQVLAPVFGTGDQQVGEVFTVSSLDNLRKRIATVLNDSGFYRFHKDFVTYTADSLQGTQGVNLVCRILPYRENSSAPPSPIPAIACDPSTTDPATATTCPCAAACWPKTRWSRPASGLVPPTCSAPTTTSRGSAPSATPTSPFARTPSTTSTPTSASPCVSPTPSPSSPRAPIRLATSEQPPR